MNKLLAKSKQDMGGDSKTYSEKRLGTAVKIGISVVGLIVICALAYSAFGFGSNPEDTGTKKETKEQTLQRAATESSSAKKTWEQILTFAGNHKILTVLVSMAVGLLIFQVGVLKKWWLKDQGRFGAAGICIITSFYYIFLALWAVGEYAYYRLIDVTMNTFQ